MIIASVLAISFVATLVRSTFGFGESLVAVRDHRQIHIQSAKWLIFFRYLYGGLIFVGWVLIFFTAFGREI